MSGFRFWVTAGFCCALLTVPVAFGEEPQKLPAVQAEVDRAVFTIGDRITYRVSVRHIPSIEILSIQTSNALRDFEIKEKKDFKYQENGNVVEGVAVVITSYTLGEYVMDPAIIQYQNESAPAGEIKSNSLYLTVESVNKGEKKPSDDIADVKGVVGWRQPWSVWLFVILACLSAAGLWMWYHHRLRGMVAGQNQQPMLSPDEEALQLLNRLYDSDLLSRGLYKNYFGEMTEILKHYFNRRFGILALESTTDELMDLVRQIDLDGKTRNLIKLVMEWCDLVKFAKYRPEPKEIIAISQQAKEIVQITTPPPEPPAPEAGNAP